MLANKMEMRVPPGSRPRDGRHCDLCGCSQPAVRCDKCGCQIFCLSCDDMYHRHPKRRFHLRKAVDSAPPVPQARPVLPVKVSQLATSNPGDPSKMPLPPPRKKKSLFGSFRKPNSSDNSPPLPKKEFTWSDRLGSIKKFMSNRPLPPLPNTDDNDSDHQPTTNGQSTRGDLSFIHRRSEERPPQLPQRSPKSPDFPGSHQENENRFPGSPGNIPGQIRNGSQEPNAMNMNQNREFSNNEENQWNNMINNQNESQKFGTLNRPQRGFMPPGAPGYPGGMHLSSSATDLHNLQNTDGMPGSGQMPPHFPHYPMNPHMPPHYPYPMYPQFPNYPQYFDNSFANLSHPTTSEGDFSDHSETASRHSSRRQPFRKRAKRSQSVLMDRMAYPGKPMPGQFYPFGPYPGYGPWGAPMPMEAPPSPASSVRSLNRSGRTRRRKKVTSEDDDEEFSMSSSPLSRPKSSSSDFKDAPRAPLATQTTSSEDESDGERDNRRNKANTIQRRQSEPLKSPSPAMEPKRLAKLKKSSSKHTDSDASEVPETTRSERKGSRDSSSDKPIIQQSPTSSSPPESWECKHCTFINPAGNKICQVCCKTATPRTETPVGPQSRPPSAAANSRKQSVSSDKGRSSPEKRPDAEEDSGKKERQDMASLNSALDEAEKQISKGLEELMKLKDDIDANMSKEKNKSTDTQSNTESSETPKPVYKSSGRMRTSILDKLNLNKPQTSNAAVSTSTETGPNSRTSDKIIEARRHSNSSTTSETYNSPMAQSPELERAFLGNRPKRDSSCQTQQDSLVEYLAKKREAEEAFLGRPVNNFGFGYGDRMDMVTSPVPSMYDRYFGGGLGMMQRSHSRASLFTGRVNDFGPMDCGGGFGYGPTPMYRSVSRGSLTGDYPDGRMSEFSNLRKPDFYLSMEELVERRRQENIRSQGLELVRMIREAEQQGFNADDIQVALSHCGKQNPLEWLQQNWRNMVDSVLTLSTNYGNDKKENDIGQLSESEARDALRLHKGNIWAAVTECVEGRQRKYLELSARGNFPRKDIVDALTSSEGDVEMAYAKLSKSTGKPFLMRIWGAGEGAQNQDGARPLPEELNDFRHRTLKDETLNSDELSEEIWSDDGEWDDEEDDYEGRGDIEDLQTCREDLPAGPQEMRTPESDKSDYCDAFPVDDRNASSPSDDIFFVIPEAKREKKKGFLSKLVALRRDSKENEDAALNIDKDELASEQIQSKEDSVSQNSASGSEQTKNGGALSALKNTLSVIKDTVTGGSKNDKKLPCAQPEKRTIIVKGQLEYNSLSNDQKNDVILTSIKPIDNDNTQTMIIEDPSETNKPEEKYSTKDSIAEKSVVQEEIKHNAEDKLKKDELKDLSLIKSEENNSSKLVKSESKGNKKTLGLAERLKFVKQYRSNTNLHQPLISQIESSPLDGIISNSSESKLPRENVSTERDRINRECTEDRNKNKLDNNASKSLNNVQPFTDREKRSENKTIEATQGSILLVDPHPKEKTKEENKFISADKSNEFSDNETPVYDIVKPNPQPVSFQHNIPISYKNDKSENEKKTKDSLQKKREEIKHQNNVTERMSEFVPNKNLSPEEMSNDVQVDSLPTNTSKCIGKDKVLQQSEKLKPDDKVKSDVPRNISDAPADTYGNGAKKAGKVEIPNESVKQTISTSSSRTEIAEYETITEPTGNIATKTEASKSKEEINKIVLKEAKMESDVPNATIMPLSGESANSVTSVTATGALESESDNIINSTKESKGMKELVNKNHKETPQLVESANISLIKSYEISQSNSTENAADSSVKISLEKTENLDNLPILSETGNTAKGEDKNLEPGPTQVQESQLETDETVSSSNVIELKENLPNPDETASINKVIELKENLPLTSLVENISGKTKESKDDIVYDKNESNSIPSERMNIPEHSSDNKASSEIEAKRNYCDVKPEEIILDDKLNSEKDSNQMKEVASISDAPQSLQNTNISSETVQKPSVSTKDQIKETGVSSKVTPPSSSLNEDPKLGKFKFSKSGKVKKTQPKEEKKLSSSPTESKNVTKSLASTPSSSHKLSTVVELSDEKSNSDEVGANKQVPASLSVANEIAENKIPIEKESNMSSTEVHEHLGTEITEAKANDIPIENNSTLRDNDNSKTLVSENKLLVQENVLGVSMDKNVEGTIKDDPVVSDTTHDLKATTFSKDSSEKSKKEDDLKMPDTEQETSVPGEIPSTSNKDMTQNKTIAASSDDSENLKMSTTEQKASESNSIPSTSTIDVKKNISQGVELQAPVISKEYPGKKNNLSSSLQSASDTNIPEGSNVTEVLPSNDQITETSYASNASNLTPVPTMNEEHSNLKGEKPLLASDKASNSTLTSRKASLIRTDSEDHSTSQAADSEDTDIDYSDESRPSSVTPPSPVDALRSRFEGLAAGGSMRGRPQSPFRRMSFNSRKQVIALERKKDVSEKPWLKQVVSSEPVKTKLPKRSIKQQLEMERKVRQMVADRKCRTYRKAEIVVQLMDMNFEEEEAIQAAHECSTLEQAISYLQQECLLCAGHFPVSQIVSMTHCQHRACRECIRAYFTVQIRDRTILDLLCPFCNEPDVSDEDVAQDYFNHLDIMLKKLVDLEIHELFQRKLRDRVLMKDPNFRWCSQCSSGFIAMPNLKRLVCPDCNAVTCASCRRLWEKEHQGISCEAFAALKDASDPEAQAAGLAKMLQEDGIACPSCHFRYALAKGGCMHFRCIQCQHDFCSGCSRPFKMGQKCGVSEFCAKLGLHAHHPRNCLFYLRDKEPDDLQKLLDMNDIKYDKESSDGVEPSRTCQVMEQKETADGMVDDHCGKDVQEGYAGLCRIHYVEYLGQLVKKHRVDPIQIFDNDDLELVLRRANIRLPPKRYRENDVQYREKLVNLIQEELPLDKMDGS